MQDELRVLEENSTWHIILLPKRKKPISCKCVYKTKYNLNGTIERHKAQLVTKGYIQREGIDFLETFFPMAKATTIKLLLAFTVSQDWHILQFDINNTFLNGDLEEEVCMEIHSVKGNDMVENVCKLHKSIYEI